MRPCGPARASISVSIRNGPSALRLPTAMPETRAAALWYRRLMLGLLLAPALLWLFPLFWLRRVDLALLSFRERVAPREYVVSLAQYRTFFDEPLYWHVFVR